MINLLFCPTCLKLQAHNLCLLPFSFFLFLRSLYRAGYAFPSLFRIPVSGEVLEQNEALADNPELVNQDPYGKGWLIKIKPNDSNDVNDLLDAEGYKALVNE